jgi:hypothetical protein
MARAVIHAAAIQHAWAPRVHIGLSGRRSRAPAIHRMMVGAATTSIRPHGGIAFHSPAMSRLATVRQRPVRMKKAPR